MLDLLVRVLWALRQKRYNVKAATLRYVFELSHNASTLSGKVIASDSYSSGLRNGYRFLTLSLWPNRIVIASCSYPAKVIISLSLFIVLLLTGFFSHFVNYTRIFPSGVNLTGDACLCAPKGGR